MPASRLSGHPYRGLWAAIATMHGKDQAVARVLCPWFGMAITNAPGIDTDALGTFTGEVPRKGTMIEAARAKAVLAIERTGAPLGLGSEGAFGPDPLMPFVASGREVLLLREAQTGHEIIVTRRTRTNFAHTVVSASDDPSPFLRNVGFPEHAVIVRPDEPGETLVLLKGLRCADAVCAAIRQVAGQSSTGKAMLQTDMRAYLNPTRMASIERVARFLAVRTARCCPSCAAPGFGITGVDRGLPCTDCNFPTDLVRAEIHGCTACGYTMRRFERSEGTRAEAKFCQVCNP